jgi:hypothetical protein
MPSLNLDGHVDTVVMDSPRSLHGLVSPAKIARLMSTLGPYTGISSISRRRMLVLRLCLGLSPDNYSSSFY